MKNARNQKGFTLVELMITVVIVGVLASVAIPLYQANVKRAKGSEAEAALGTIRTALRVYYAENATYPKEKNYKAVTALKLRGIDIDPEDLVGKYFPSSAYKYKSKDGKKYTIQATGAGASKGINRQIDETGNLSDF